MDGENAALHIVEWMKANPRDSRPVGRLYPADDLLPEEAQDPERCIEAMVSMILEGSIQGAPVQPLKYLSEDVELALREAPYLYGYAPLKSGFVLSQALVEAVTRPLTRDEAESQSFLNKQYMLTPKNNY